MSLNVMCNYVEILNRFSVHNFHGPKSAKPFASLLPRYYGITHDTLAEYDAADPDGKITVYVPNDKEAVRLTTLPREQQIAFVQRRRELILASQYSWKEVSHTAKCKIEGEETGFQGVWTKRVYVCGGVYARSAELQPITDTPRSHLSWLRKLGVTSFISSFACISNYLTQIRPSWRSSSTTSLIRASSTMMCKTPVAGGLLLYNNRRPSYCSHVPASAA